MKKRSGGRAKGVGASKGTLSERHWKILNHLKDGAPSKVVAEQMNMREATVKYHLTRIYKILGVSNRIQALAAAQSIERHKPGEG